ncbi:MAG: hypothetical protein K5746_05510 [Clostridiales bacterium]|nr:hypothetical protein [Clostridiales bacterium]
MSEEKTTEKGKRVPLRRAEHWGFAVPGTARRAAFILLVSVILGMLFSGISGIGQNVVRVLISIFISILTVALFFFEGLGCGTKDAVESRRVRKIERDGGAAKPKELAGCWHPAKCAAALLMVFLLPLLLGAWISLTAEPYHYQLQDLPLWLTENYGKQEEVMTPLAAYTAEPTGADARTILRIGLRVLIMPFIGFFADPQTEVFRLDRLSPVFLLLYPLAFFIGYLFGPRRSRKIAKQERHSKKVAVKKAEKSSLAEKLTRGGGEVHYGGRAGKKEEKHKLV